MPAESPMQTTARSPGARFRYSRPGRTKSPPFRGLVRRREKCRKGTKCRAMYRPRSRQPWRRGSDRTACGRIPPAWRESSRRTLPLQVAPVRALRRMAAQRRSLSPRQKAKCRRPAGHIVSGEVAGPASRTVHQEFVCELGTPSHCRVFLVGRDLAEFLAFGECHFARQLDVELAFRGADKSRGVLLVKGEVDEDCRIIDLDLQFLRLYRCFERQREIERQHLVVVVEPVVWGGVSERDLRPVCAGKGEIVELLERLDVDLGQRSEFLAGKLALLFALEPLDGKGREHVVERPGVTNTCDSPVGRVDQIGAHGHPNVRMRLRRSDDGERGECDEKTAKHAGTITRTTA